MATTDIKLTFGYADETKRDFKLGPFAQNAAAISGAKAAIKNFNSNNLSNVANVLISDGGASCTGIVDAYIITSNSREINLNDAE